MKFDTEWTLESGPAEAPDVLDLSIEYNYSFGTPDSWTEPGDPPEVEITEVCYGIKNPEARSGYDWIQLSLLPAEQEKVETWIHENPPEAPVFEDDY